MTRSRGLFHKFHAKPTEADGIRFASKAEARRYEHLKLAQRGGTALFFLRQVPFHLPGGVVYRCDFLVFWADGRVTVEDVKAVLAYACTLVPAPEDAAADRSSGV